MTKKKLMTEKELVKGMTPDNTHVDELASISDKEWLSFGDGLEKADDDFLAERDDVFDESRLKLEEDEVDRALVKRRENSPEIDVDIDNL